MNTLLKSLAAAALPIAFLILSSTMASAQEAKPTKKAEKHSPIGIWTWERESGDSTIESTVTIKEKDGKFSGKLVDEEHDLKIENCKLEEETFSFEVFPHPEKPDLAIKFKGKVSADQIKGKMNYTVKNENKSIPWTAKRYDPLDAVLGKWLLEFETPDGTALAFKILAKKKGKGLGVTFVDDKTVKVRNVEFKNSVLTFESDQVYQDEPITVEWDLTVDGDQASGVLYYSFVEAEGEGEIELSGERVK